MYSSNFNNSLLKISQINMDLQQALVSIKRVLNLIDKDTEKEYIGNTRINHDIFKSDIKIENLSFKYRENDKYILKDLNLNIKKNVITAIVGKNGQGKTTLLKILMGLYRDYEGKILFDGFSLEEVPFNKISNKISYVPQETFLFTGTIKENLLLANENATYYDIKSACKLVNIDDIIESFENGYDTQIGYDGISLSGGQKQRLGIARALLRKADLFLFDEITSSVDIETDDIIKSVLKEISKNKTVILVTHKKTTLSIADNIINLDKCEFEPKIILEHLQ
ncbi:ATP-binding cassette domain-containing protein [Clostridium akagii]|uniref:ATP-binding cassette domain-containing protein n=1 Tax=Clostridium akagii TaxID=91623 RepID=UPI00047EA059|nr:ATP-binding cassette domain-containing protein [Clostridium akagii]